MSGQDNSFFIQGELFVDTTNAEKQLDQFGQAAGKRLGKSIDFDNSNFNNKVDQSFHKVRALQDQVGAGAKKVGDDLDKSAAPAQNFGKAIASSIDAADQKLKEFGFSFRGISILLGAGLAGGVLGVIRILEKFVTAVKDAVEAEHEFERQTNLTFGKSATEVREFGGTLEDTLGASRSEAQKTLTQFALLGRQIGFTGKDLVGFTEGLSKFAIIIKDTVPGFATIDDSSKKLQDAIKGDNDALKELGITTKDVNEASARLFQRAFENLSDAERAVVLYNIGIQKSKDATDQLVGSTDGLVGLVRQVDESEQSLRDKIVGQKDSTRELGKLWNVIKDTALDHLDTQIRIVEKVVEWGQQHSKILKLLGGIAHFLHIGTEEQDKSVELAKKATELTEKEFLTAQNMADARRDAINAQERLNDVTEEGEKRVAEAELQLSRTREDNANKRAELELRNERTISDSRLRLNRALQDAELDEAQRNLRALDREQKFQDTQLKVDRANRTAQEKLDDFRIDHKRRIAEDEKKITDARIQQANKLLEAELSVGQAIRRGDADAENAARRQLATDQQDKSLADAQKKLREDRADDETKVSRLIRDQKETRADGIRELQQAERTRQEAVLQENKNILTSERQIVDARTTYDRAIADAADALNDLEVQQNRALFDAKKRIEDAETARDKAIRDAAQAFEEVANKIGIAVDRLHALIDGLIIAKNQFDFGVPGTPGFVPPGGTAHGATGFRNFRGGLAVVGEDGPELVRLPKGSDVFTHEDSKKIMTGAQQTNHITINRVANDDDATAFAVSARLARNLN